jgi:hypothetical protein
MVSNKKNELVTWFKTILNSIGFTDIVDKLNKVTNNATCFFPETNMGDKTISFVVLNKEVANATKKRFRDWNISEGAIVESTGRNNVFWKITIPFRVLEKVKKGIETKQKSYIPVKKTKERLYIENLLFGKGITPNINQGEDDFWFTITFRRPEDCDKAKKLLTDSNIDYDDSCGKTTLFVLVSLPDALPKQELQGEREEEQKNRHITEYYGRLILLVSKTLGFTVGVPYGPRHKGEKFVTISKTNENCRLEFCSPKEKSVIEAYLTTAGFSCEKPRVDKEYVIIVNLSKSTQAVLTQNIVVKEPAFQNTLPALEEQQTILITEKSGEMIEEKKVTPLSEIREAMKKIGVTPGTFVKKDNKITLTIKKGNVQDAITEITRVFNIEAKISPRKTSIVLSAESVRIKERSTKSKTISKKDPLAELKAFLANAHQTLEELQNLTIASKEQWLKEIQEKFYLCTIEDGKIILPMSNDTIISGGNVTFVVKTLKKQRK